MPVRRSSTRIACLEEAATTARERAQASDPPTEQGRGAARTTGVPQHPNGQVDEGEDEKEDDEKINIISPCHREAEARSITTPELTIPEATLTQAFRST